MKFSCGGVLPENIHTFDLSHLPGPLVLQVNEVVDISGHPEDRRLLLTMTDGARYILGVETRPIKDLQVSAPAGFKVLIHKGSAFDGFLQLVLEGLELLGGMVEDLRAECKKSVEEVIKSPKGEIMQTDDAALKPKEYDEIVKDNSNRLTDEYKAMPYTYLTSLLAEWDQRKMVDDRAPIRRKIQGMMTGLSRLEFYGRTEYELVVKFDDGSCTSDVVIHHDMIKAGKP
ncbi:hypothetical protein C5167_050847 [Papaver somniferum]|uniref:RecQ-mediated genome instability protein 1 n=1 Tax=Papaver somniferum TaxID=3469 RepID=A0A4Y7KT69_PAPSO|nr:hypothetical protein C5167_050847 [Papaver somniferum]